MSDKKEQYNVRMELELQERLSVLGARLGLSGNQFAAEALRRYGDILCEVMEEEEAALDRERELHRRKLRDRLQSSRSV